MKKWTYLVAAVLMSGTAPFFTSCIDNDEPEGITILRKAKAELITARKAIIEAEATRLKAEAALKEAEAEFKLAQAELQRAKAKRQEALTEAEKAKYEAEIKKLQAQTEEIVKRMEADLQKALLEQKEALEELKKAETNATKAQWEALKPYKEAYQEASNDYYKKSKTVLEKQRGLAQAEADKKVSVEDRRKAERAVKMAERDFEAAKAYLAGLQEEYNEKLPTLVPGEIPAKIAALNKEITKLEQDIQLVEVEKAEAKENNPEYAKFEELKKALKELGDKEIAIAEFKNTINPDEAKYWNYEMDQVVLEASHYTLNDLAEYNYAIGQLRDFRDAALRYQLDEDDVKWNEALLNEAKVGLEAAKKQLVNEEALFTAAVKAYNEGKGMDVTAYIGYDKLVEAVAAYNTAADALDAQKEVVGKMLDLENAAKNAYLDKAADETLYSIDGIHNDALGKADLKRKNTIATARAEYDAAVLPLQDKYQDDLLAVSEAEKAEALALAKLEVTDKADKEKYEAAKKDYDAAVAKTQKAVETKDATLKALGDAISTEGNKVANVIKVADAEYELDKQKADNAREKAIREWETGLDPEYVKALADLKNKWKEAEGNRKVEEGKLDKESVRKAIETVERTAWAIDVKLKGFTDDFRFNYEINEALNLLIHSAVCYDLDVAKLFVVKSAKDYLISVSKNLYGTFSADAMYDDEWPAERITPLDRAGVDAIIKKYMPEVAERNYHLYYDSFGYFGREVLGQEVDIEIAQSVIDNSEKFDALVASIEEAMAALDKSHEDAKDGCVAAVEAVEAQQEVIDGIEEVFNEKIAGFEEVKAIKNELLKAYSSVNLTDEQKYTEESIKIIKKEMASSIEKAEDAIFDKETAVMAAKDALENIAKPDATAIDQAKFELQLAQMDQERAQKAMEIAEKELLAATDKIMGDDAE